MDQIIIEHYKNSRNFLSIEDFKIPFIVDNGLYFNIEQVFKNSKYYEGILINKEKEGFCISYYENRNKSSEGNYKNSKQEGLWIYYYNNGNKMSEENWKNGKIEGFWTFYYYNGIKMSE